MKRWALVLFLFAFGVHAEELFPIYTKYLDAIARGDAAAAKKFLSAGKLKQLAGKPDDEVLSALDVISPKEGVRVYREVEEGDDATLIVRARVAENDSTGRIEFVREKDHWKILSELWDIGGEPDAAPTTDFIKAETDDQRDAVRKLREMGFAAPGPSFLNSSAAEGNLDAVKLFIAAGVSPDHAEQGAPAIVTAAMFNHPDIVKFLVGAGANVNAEDEVHTTALMRLADKCDATETIRFLIKKGAKTTGKTAGGATAVQLAEWSSCTDNADLLRGAKK